LKQAGDLVKKAMDPYGLKVDSEDVESLKISGRWTKAFSPKQILGGLERWAHTVGATLKDEKVIDEGVTPVVKARVSYKKLGATAKKMMTLQFKKGEGEGKANDVSLHRVD
jgi:hypothetical protein